MTSPAELYSVLQFFLNWGWIITPIVLFFVWRDLWLKWVQKEHSATLNWVTLELKIPNVVERTPKVMEQVFGGLHGMKSKVNLIEKWWQGKFQYHISLEIVGLEGSAHFFIHTPEKYKKVIHSQIYAQYKDAELSEVKDYTIRLPADIPNEEYDIWGTELMFTKDDAYPIRTYRFFEEPSTEKKYIDPLASLVELLGELGQGEYIFTQCLIRPVGTEWQKEGQYLIDKLIGKKEAKRQSSGIFEEVFQFFYDLAMAIFAPPKTPQEEKAQEKSTPETLMQHLPPGMKDVVAALEESISKHGFESVIRIMYVARRDVFSSGNIAALMGAFKQFSTYNLNGFKPNDNVTTSIDYFFKKTRELLRGKRLYQWMRERSFKDIWSRKRMILNTEELATVYHVPSVVLEVPTLEKIMAKKSEPPAGLLTI